MSWFSIRNIYLRGEESDGSAVYEERSVLFRADSPEQAFEMAEAEAARYLQVNPTFRRVGQPVAFMLGAKEDDLHKAEVWSVLGSSNLGPDEFLQKYYMDVEFQEDESETQEDDRGPVA